MRLQWTIPWKSKKELNAALNIRCSWRNCLKNIRLVYSNKYGISTFLYMLSNVFGSPSLPLQRPAPPQLAALAPGPFGASTLYSLKRPQSHESKPVDEYYTTPFCNGAFRGEIRDTGALSRVIYGTLAYRSVWFHVVPFFFHSFWISHLNCLLSWL